MNANEPNAFQESTAEKMRFARHLFSFGQRPGDLACAVEEELRHRIQRPIPQGDDPDRPWFDRQFDRQHLERQIAGAEMKHAAREKCEVAAAREQTIAYMKRKRQHRSARNLQSAGVECLRRERTTNGSLRRENPGLIDQFSQPDTPSAGPGARRAGNHIKLLVEQYLCFELVLGERCKPAYREIEFSLS